MSSRQKGARVVEPVAAKQSFVMATHLCSVCASRLCNCGEVLEDVASGSTLVHHIIHHVSRHHNLLLHHVSKCQRGAVRIPETCTHLLVSVTTLQGTGNIEQRAEYPPEGGAQSMETRRWQSVQRIVYV